MCGIVSVCHGREVPGLGHEAGELLRRLEYRGYDSTGAAFVRGDRSVKLLKKVGAPSRVVPEMGIDREAGQRFVGQVRWATYGAVTDANAQPHGHTVAHHSRDRTNSARHSAHATVRIRRATAADTAGFPSLTHAKHLIP